MTQAVGPGTKWPRLSITVRVSILMVVAIVLLAATGALILTMVARQQNATTVINVAGRQRMLIERTVKDALLTAAGDERARSRLPEWRQEFSVSL